jgi:hypothetical protein
MTVGQSVDQEPEIANEHMPAWACSSTGPDGVTAFARTSAPAKTSAPPSRTKGQAPNDAEKEEHSPSETRTPRPDGTSASSPPATSGNFHDDHRDPQRQGGRRTIARKGARTSRREHRVALAAERPVPAHRCRGERQHRGRVRRPRLVRGRRPVETAPPILSLASAGTIVGARPCRGNKMSGIGYGRRRHKVAMTPLTAPDRVSPPTPL